MKKKILKNQRGQTLIEYLIIVALVGVGSIAMMRVVGESINKKFAGVIKSLGGNVESSIADATVTKAMLQKRDLKDFVRGARASKSSSSSSSQASNGSDDSASDSE